MRIGLLSALGLLFVGLKLGSVISWSWWWVLSPFWLPLAIFLAIAGVMLTGAFLIALFSDR